jgi:hypothetical protein
MRAMMLAAFAIFSLAACSGPVETASDFHNGSSVADIVVATRMQQTGAYGL